ncbi:alpha/beta hydrolase [Mucilaginibacter segetis]|uniref:Alpha/beta hydrolase n=1 Tax=Mucilaginibacter segetis TaxID=2793071 RepID=A0A934PXJ9_9SPHI|nr:alpha/beta hydrolase [Mucilaginibacter segetis]MBK0381286.1 alpha/beta hydrolase [Mucilaginibacter segetis]
MLLRKIVFLMLVISSATAFAQKQNPIPLYSGEIPNSKKTPATYVERINSTDWITDVSIPVLTPYLPDKGTANGAAVIVFPGGGYAGLASGYEGRDIALAFNKIGVTAFVVKYRLPSDSIMVDKTIGPLQDAQRAIQLVREGADKWGIDAHRIGIIGFSAGGHLASTLETHYGKVLIPNKLNTSLRPDFALLLYPVITFGPLAHVGSRENLIGKNASQELIDLYSNEKQVTGDTPPTFIVHAGDDDVVPVQNSLMMYEALLNAKVKSELHIFQAGGHGFGLNNPKSKDHWFDWARAWMDENGWLNK